ncbi:fungal-specific transcription factor domain-containing protein, partial [Thelonectria olida]
PARRRGTIACRRCRRLRTKCEHRHSMPPCTACARAGPQAASECQFPRRGDKDIDREFRRRPVEDKGATLAPVLNPVVFGTQPFPPASRPTVTPTPPGSSGQLSPQTIGTVFSSPSRTLAYPTPASTDNILPPTDEVVEGCRVFVTTYFQLGFIPKATFLDNLRTNPGSVSRFLLACILSISARFTKTLVRRYGSARKATDHFLQVARSMVPTEMYNPSLERIQAFFLLAISQWGNDDRDRSSMDMGVAVRMAALLKLHCEESYALPPNCPADRVVRSESARRVFWMIQSQENLHSGYKTPAPFPLEDITTLLPCDERDFAFGHIPNERAAEAGTPPALANPELVNSPNRCLFATLIQAHGLWGRVARKACRNDNAINKVPPWSLDSELQTTIIELGRWEGLLPEEHTFSVWNLSAWKHQSLHLAYLSVTMVLRLTHIVARRVYLHDMLATLTNEQLDQSLESTTPTMANANENFSSTSHPTPASTPCGTLGTAPQYFWEKTSEELFDNVSKLHDQINEYFKIKSSDEGFPQILVFCVYMCGSLSSFLWRYPTLCPRFGSRGNGEMMARRCLEVLSALHAAWPTSSNWQKGLQ